MLEVLIDGVVLLALGVAFTAIVLCGIAALVVLLIGKHEQAEEAIAAARTWRDKRRAVDAEARARSLR